MVAAHSIVRVSVCRASNGLSIFKLFFADGLYKVMLKAVHSLHYSIHFPAFLMSAFQTRPDNRYFSDSLLGQTQLHSPPALAVLQMAAGVGQCRDKRGGGGGAREREIMFVSGCNIFNGTERVFYIFMLFKIDDGFCRSDAQALTVSSGVIPA